MFFLLCFRSICHRNIKRKELLTVLGRDTFHSASLTPSQSPSFTLKYHLFVMLLTFDLFLQCCDWYVNYSKADNLASAWTLYCKHPFRSLNVCISSKGNNKPYPGWFRLLRILFANDSTKCYRINHKWGRRYASYAPNVFPGF